MLFLQVRLSIFASATWSHATLVNWEEHFANGKFFDQACDQVAYFIFEKIYRLLDIILIMIQ